MIVLQLIYITASKPYFTNLPQAVTVLDTVAIGTYVYTVSYSDANAADIPYLTIQKNNAPEFTLNSATGKVQLYGGNIISKDQQNIHVHNHKVNHHYWLI